MPTIVDYETVLQRLTGQGLRCNYFNSGAFGFADGAGAMVRGWLGPPDATIKLAALGWARFVAPPFAANLARLACLAWQRLLPGVLWAMPKSHWAYELNHGSRPEAGGGLWLPTLLKSLNLDSVALSVRSDAAAIEFAAEEVGAFERFALVILQADHNSDFMLAFPGRPTVCTLHSHKQLWWETSDHNLIGQLDGLLDEGGRAPAG